MAKKYSEHDENDDEYLAPWVENDPNVIKRHEKELSERKVAYEKYKNRDYSHVEHKYGPDEEYGSKREHLSFVKEQVGDVRDNLKSEVSDAHKTFNRSSRSDYKDHFQAVHEAMAAAAAGEISNEEAVGHSHASRRSTVDSIKESRKQRDGTIARAQRDHALEMHRLYEEHGPELVDAAVAHHEQRDAKRAATKAERAKSKEPAEDHQNGDGDKHATSEGPVQTGPRGGKYRVLKSGEKTYLIK